jgi:hypothetical protein
VPRKKKVKRIGTIDCETDPFEPGMVIAPFLWGVMLAVANAEGVSYFEFQTIEALVQWLSAPEQGGLVLYAHNGGKFDYHFLRDHIQSDEPISVIAGRLARCKIGGCELRDSLNLFGQTRLADFSKKEIDYKKMRASERAKPEVWAEIREYLKYDCESLLKLVSSFIDKFGMQFTQAGAAMKYWKKHHAPNHEIPNSTVGFYDRFHPFYFGGRVQCFASGHARESFSVVDINSAYPFAMLSEHAYSTGAPLTTSRLPKNESSIPQCFIKLDAVAKGCFPLRAEDGSLYFPDDSRMVRTYHVTGWELIAALDTHTVDVKRIRAVHRFEQQVSFKDYVEHFFALRREAKAAGDKAQDISAKVFLTSLYGKFSANPRKYREFVLSAEGSDEYARWIQSDFENQGMWGGRSMLFRPVPEHKHRYYNVVTGASITGYVRAYLWRALNKVSGPIYCDTDAIAAKDVSRIDTGDKLGQWKIEAECDEYAIGGKKNYAFHVAGSPRNSFVRRQKPLENPRSADEWTKARKSWKIASKGADLSPKQMIRVATGGVVSYENPVPNFSMHLPMPGTYLPGKLDRSFQNRQVKSTYKDISQYEAA